MTLLEAKNTAMKLIDQYSSTTEPTDDTETADKLSSLFDAAQVFACTIKPIYKSITIAYTPGVSVLVEYDLPADFRQLKSARDENGNNYWAEVLGKKILFSGDEAHTIRVDYYAYPSHISDDTPDTYEFEVDQDVQQIIPYRVAADILKTDPSVDYTAFELVYNNMISNIDPRPTAGIFHVSGGINF